MSTGHECEGGGGDTLWTTHRERSQIYWIREGVAIRIERLTSGSMAVSAVLIVSADSLRSDLTGFGLDVAGLPFTHGVSFLLVMVGIAGVILDSGLATVQRILVRDYQRLREQISEKYGSTPAHLCAGVEVSFKLELESSRSWDRGEAHGR